jgi:hypothetical protein
MNAGAAAWDAARALVGTRFRLQGRDAATGLDCVGVIIAAYAAAGVRLDCLADYPLRGFPVERALAVLSGLPLQRVLDAGAAGDMGLYALPAGQLHFAIIGAGTLVHADAALRRVVEAPLARLPAPVGRWRC